MNFKGFIEKEYIEKRALEIQSFLVKDINQRLDSLHEKRKDLNDYVYVGKNQIHIAEAYENLLSFKNQISTIDGFLNANIDEWEQKLIKAGTSLKLFF